jgi:hypothetical protein
MVTILCALVSIFEFRVRSRASLELELIAPLHQVTVLRRQRPGRPQLSSLTGSGALPARDSRAGSDSAKVVVLVLL